MLTRKTTLISEMDLHIKRMLKLIEDDADSFAKKAEMYYQKRPQLIALVEEFHSMFRTLVERCDNFEPRKSVHSDDLLSQCSGISEVISELNSTMPSPDIRINKTGGVVAKSFDFFNANCRGTDESSVIDSECESDNDDDYIGYHIHGNESDSKLRDRVMELEAELREAKEKLRLAHEEEEVVKGLFGSDEASCEKRTEEFDFSDATNKGEKDRNPAINNHVEKLELHCRSLRHDVKWVRDEIEYNLRKFANQTELFEATLVSEIKSRDDQIDRMSDHLYRLQIENAELVARVEGLLRIKEEMSLSIRELEMDIVRKQEIVEEGAEEKREAIRQLCFSLEHYRNGYHRLREVVLGHDKIRLPVDES